MNPSGYAPLTAEISLTTTRPVQIELAIEGRLGPAGTVQNRFPEVATSFVIPVLGLYASASNNVVLRFFEADGKPIGEVMRTIDTGPLLAALPQMTVHVNSGRKKPGMNLVSYFGHTDNELPQIPYIFDTEGAIRWYVNLDAHPVLGHLFYDAGVERLKNGNLYFGDGSSGRIVELDMMGHVVNEWPLPGYGFHHNVLEMPNGNFLATVNKHGLPTIEDHILEIDRATGSIVQVWDLRQSLDSKRRIWSGNARDWFHANGLAYDLENDAIIVSGRVQGTVKLTRDNEVIWILAPHRGWDLAGSGADLKTKLLQPLDANGQPITDLAVLDGMTNHADFEWSWYQHAPKLMPDGTLLLFDNGDNRNYGGQPPYSRAVIYRIDEQAMTIQQLWEYGKDRGGETYSGIVSDVDYHAEENTVVFMPGAIWDGQGPHGRTVEIDFNTGEVVYEASIRKADPASGITFHRVERLPLYPPAH